MSLDKARRLLLNAQTNFDQQQAILRDAHAEVISLEDKLLGDEPLTPVDRKFAAALVKYVNNGISYRRIKRMVEDLYFEAGKDLDLTETTTDPELMCGCECGCNIKVETVDGIRGRGCQGLCDNCAGLK